MKVFRAISPRLECAHPALKAVNLRNEECQDELSFSIMRQVLVHTVGTCRSSLSKLSMRAPLKVEHRTNQSCPQRTGDFHQWCKSAPCLLLT